MNILLPQALLNQAVNSLHLYEEQAAALKFVHSYGQKLIDIALAAKHLRECQVIYMANKGNEELGQKVGIAAKELDEVLLALETKKEP